MTADKAVLANMAEARSNGYELSCSYCGAGIADESDLHDWACTTLTPEFQAARAASERAFYERLSRVDSTTAEDGS